ncbi:MAG: TonB-dependent receptor [Bacteroidales bacterium]|nr:TonB-dependent receptor [Bacteroidales bacterium]
MKFRKEIFFSILAFLNFNFYVFGDNLPSNSENINSVEKQKATVSEKEYVSNELNPEVNSNSISISQQNSINVKGQVVDASNGDPLIGVSIMLESNPTQGTTTDIDGNFSITVPSNESLVFTYVGYKKNVVKVNGKTQISIKMEPDNETLDEVVVVGYGTQKKVSVIGSISTVSAKQLKTPVAKISSNLAGQLSGIIAYQRSGEPGTGSTFWIRGVSSFSGTTTPLVLVDGIERSIDLVDPEDIKDFSVLKDASATAIYGVRGANGVVLITTNSGQEGKAKISARFETGVVAPTKVPETASALQFAEMYNEAYGYNYFSEEAMEAYKTGSNPDLYPNVDWMDNIFKKNSFNRRGNVSVSGGAKIVKYYISGGYYGEDGLFKVDGTKNYNTESNYNKYNFRSNIDLQLEKNTVLNLNLATVFEQINRPGTDAGDIFDYALVTPANAFPIRYSTGEYAGPGSGQGSNPYALVTETGYRQYFYNNAQTLIGLNHDFGWLLKGLKGTIKYSFDAYNSHYQGRTRTPEQYGQPVYDEEGNLHLTQLVQGSQTLGFGYSSSGNRRNYLEASLNYAHKFGAHSLTGLLLFQQSQTNYVGSSATTSDAALPYRNQGVAGRITYDYDLRYFIEFNAGYNGSENFAPGNRFGFFPAVAAGWLISNESFWEPLSETVDMLKIKGSWGKVGNDKIGGDRRFIYLGTINNSAGSYSFGTNAGGQSGIRIGDEGNPNVGWEQADKLDLGFDVSLFNSLKIQFDYFREKRTGIFLQRKAIPVFAGLSTNPYVNIGEMHNKGIDGSVDFNRKFGEVLVTAKGTFTFARNVIVNMDQPDWAELYMNRTGQAQWQSYGYVSDGLFQSQEDIDSHADQSLFSPKPGDIKYVDLNNDGVIDERDTKPIGWRNVPEIVFGFGASASWKGFDLSLFFQGNDHVQFSKNTSLVRGFSPSTGNINQANVLSDLYGNYWTEDNPDAKYPRLTSGTNTNNSQSSDYWLVDGKYIRLKNAELGYALPRKLVNKMKLSGLRFYLQGQNLFCISPFDLWDPDLQTGASSYPTTKVVSIGVSLGI